MYVILDTWTEMRFWFFSSQIFTRKLSQPDESGDDDDDDVCVCTVELSAADAVVEMGSGVGDGQHRGAQDGRTDSTYWQLHRCTNGRGDC